MHEALKTIDRLRSGTKEARRDLAEARRDVELAVEQGQAPDSIRGGEISSSLDPWAVGGTAFAAARIAGDFLPAPTPIVPGVPGTQVSSLVNVRTSPLPGLDPLAPDWTRGLRPSASRGPFTDELGERFWIDTFLLPRLVSVMAAGAILVRLPVRGRLAVGQTLRLGTGSVWLPTRLLVPGRPGDEFAGLRISGGTVRLVGTLAISGSTVTLSGAWRLRLDLQVAGDTGSGVKVPARLAVTLTPGGLDSDSFSPGQSTAYGSTVTVERSAAAPFYDPLTRSVVLPGEASLPAFAFAGGGSAVWRASGAAAIERSGWALAVTATTAEALGEAAGAGSLWLELGAGIALRWQGLPAAVQPIRTVLSLSPEALLTVAVLPAGVTQRLRLWNEAAGVRQASAEVTSLAGSTVVHLSQKDSVAVLFSGRIAAHLDRPLEADGGRIRLHMPAGTLRILSTAAGVEAAVLGADAQAVQAPHIAFALENALLKVRPPAWLLVRGSFASDQSDQIVSGTLTLRFPFRSLLRTLPDPYAANFPARSRTDVDTGWARARVTWTAPESVRLDFQVDTPAAADTFDTRRSTPNDVLLDVSSRADQFGVAVPASALGIEGLSLVAPARDVVVLTLPPISWEPMLTREPEQADLPPSPPGTPPSHDIRLPPPPHDGGPAMLRTEVVELRPVDPVPLLKVVRDEIRGDQRFRARLPLPFGVVGNVERKEKAAGAHVESFLNRPFFKDRQLRGGLQLALQAGPHSEGFRDPSMPGFVELIDDDDYALGVLSANVYTRFQGDFADSVPLRRYELSGYGASLFSDWRDPQAVGPAIIQARFDVLVGRTAHEVVQMQSILYPWHVRVVRTITMDRQAGGWVLREDSGWLAASAGRLAYQGDPNALPGPLPPTFPAANVHSGAINGVFNVRHIQLDGAQLTLPSEGGTVWQPVRFDAEVSFKTGTGPRLAVSGGSDGSAAAQVASRGITGWILIDGPLYNTAAGSPPQTVHRVRPADAQQIQDLLDQRGPAVAPLACTLLLGGADKQPGLEMNAFRVEVTSVGAQHLVAAVRGTPLLPRDGAWSLARLAAADSEPKALDPGAPIPLVQPNSATAGTGRWHFAEPQDILHLADAATPATVYGFVQSLGAQKVFFPRPKIGDTTAAVKPINFPQPPKLADMGALLHAAGIFPGLAAAFDIKQLQALEVGKDGIGFDVTSEVSGEALLLDLGGADAIQIVIQYRDEDEAAGPHPTRVTLKLDPAGSPRWSITLSRVCFTVVFKKSPLIRIFADVKAAEGSPPSVSGLNVRYDDFLAALQFLFSNIEQVARFLPGGAAAGLKVAFSQGHLTVRDSFSLPNLPLGAGEITDVALEMGFEVSLAPLDVSFVAGIGRSDKPFRWVVSPFAGTGVVQVGINTHGLDILVQGGLGLGLAIDLGIVAGSASVTLAVELNTGPDPFELRGILSGRASVDVLRGLASATLTLAAGLGIIPPAELLKPPPLRLEIPDHIGPFTVGLTASVAVGVHLTVCWVVDVDWDGYWQFRQDVTIPRIDIPVA